MIKQPGSAQVCIMWTDYFVHRLNKPNCLELASSQLACYLQSGFELICYWLYLDTHTLVTCEVILVFFVSDLVFMIEAIDEFEFIRLVSSILWSEVQ